MPLLSRLFIRSSLVHLVLGFTFGGLLLSHKGTPIHPSLWRLRPGHIEILLVGWIIQLALGVAFWILPRFWEAPVRGNETGAWIAFVLLNAGVWLVVLATALGWPPVLVLSGRVAEVAAGIAFALHIWPRILPRNIDPS